MELKDLFAAVDQAFIQVKNSFENEVRCSEGCDDCCHAVFDVSLIEAISIVRSFQKLPEQEKTAALKAAQEAVEKHETLLAGNNNELATARIRCPLLTDQGICRCYEVRPINCRTYGIPTVIHDAGHVCGLSGFDQGVSYPTVNLEQLQAALYEMSVKAGGEELARKRWPVALLLLGGTEVDGLVNPK